MTIRRSHPQTEAEAGFTLIEISIAAAILGSVLLLLSAMFINLVQRERAAVGLRDSVASTSAVMNDIAASAREAGSFKVVDSDSDTGQGQLCMYLNGTGGSMVHYFVGKTDSATNYGLYRVTQPPTDDCSAITYDDATSFGYDPKLLSADGISPTSFQAWGDASAAIPLINVRVAMTSATDLSEIQGPTGTNPGACIGDTKGDCEVSVIETSISIRGTN